ncbi:MAG: hypothetical protein RL033_4435 [Pseudomonadota bacterium]
MVWHRAHQAECGCRPIPARLQEQMLAAAQALPVPSGAETKFSNIVLAFADEPAVSYGGKGFGSRALNLGGQIFAMLTATDEFVVRLSRARADELVAQSKGKYFDPGHGRPMKEWLVAPAGSGRWLELAREAHTIAQGRRSRASSPALLPRATASRSTASASGSTAGASRSRAPARDGLPRREERLPARSAKVRARKLRSTPR